MSKISNTGEQSTLYSFTGGVDGGYGNDYSGSLVRDSAGNLYGTMLDGGDLSCSGFGGQGCGVVFKLRRAPKSGCPAGTNSGNGWCETVLYSFKV